VINFQGGSFATSIILAPGDIIKFKYKQYFQNPVIINPGKFTTRITFSQLDYISGPSVGIQNETGPTGNTGPPGLANTMYSISFDGGSSSTSYIAGPAFDCGSSS
jgi:hypothetical protein